MFAIIMCECHSRDAVRVTFTMRTITKKGTCVEFGPTQLPVGLGLGLGLRLGLGLGLGLRLGLGLGLGLRLELGLGLGLGPNLIDRKLGGPEPDTSAPKSACVNEHQTHNK